MLNIKLLCLNLSRLLSHNNHINIIVQSNWLLFKPKEETLASNSCCMAKILIQFNFSPKASSKTAEESWFIMHKA